MSATGLFPLTLLLLSHYLADYLSQPRWFTFKKRTHIGYLLLHGLVVWAFLIILFSPYHDQGVLPVISVIAGLHLSVDWVKVSFKQARYFTGRKRVNTVDQVIHLGIILIAWLFFFRNLAWPFASGPPSLLLNSFSVAVLLLIGSAAVRHFFKKSADDDIPE